MHRHREPQYTSRVKAEGISGHYGSVTDTTKGEKGSNFPLGSLNGTEWQQSEDCLFNNTTFQHPYNDCSLGEKQGMFHHGGPSIQSRETEKSACDELATKGNARIYKFILLQPKITVDERWRV